MIMWIPIAKILRDGGEALAEGDMDNTHASRYISRVTDGKSGSQQRAVCAAGA